MRHIESSNHRIRSKATQVGQCSTGNEPLFLLRNFFSSTRKAAFDFVERWRFCAFRPQITKDKSLFYFLSHRSRDGIERGLSLVRLQSPFDATLVKHQRAVVLGLSKAYKIGGAAIDSTPSVPAAQQNVCTYSNHGVCRAKQDKPAAVMQRLLSC